MNKILKRHEENKAKIKAWEDEMAKIAKLAGEEYKNVSQGGISTPESMFILGFVAGYKKKIHE